METLFFFSQENTKRHLLGVLDHSHSASFFRSCPSPPSQGKPLVTMFSLHNTALLDKLTGPEWSHDSVTAIRIPTAPGNWELRLRDGQATWDTLPQRIFSLKVCMTTNHAQRLRKHRGHTERSREKAQVLPTCLAAFWFPVLMTCSYLPGLGVQRDLQFCH